jgi:hypothetical protein
MCVTSLGSPYEKKYVKDDVSNRDSLKKTVSQRGLGSHRPHGTAAGLMWEGFMNALSRIFQTDNVRPGSDALFTCPEYLALPGKAVIISQSTSILPRASLNWLICMSKYSRLQ